MHAIEFTCYLSVQVFEQLEGCAAAHLYPGLRMLLCSTRYVGLYEAPGVRTSADYLLGFAVKHNSFDTLQDTTCCNKCCCAACATLPMGPGPGVPATAGL